MSWKPKIFTIWIFKEKLAKLGLEDEGKKTVLGKLK